jgi:hypothetical protein
VTDQPTVALLAAPGTAARAVPLLGIVGRRASVVSWRRRGDRVPDAVVATTLAAFDDAELPGSVPWAVWVRDPQQLTDAHQRGASVVLSADPKLVAEGAVLVPPVGVEVDRWPWAPPLVRSRRRQRLGLPDRHVVRVPDDEDPALTAPLDAPRVSPLATCSVAVVHGPATLVALALGAPTVTSAETARRLGLRPGRDVEVAAGPTQAKTVAEAIAADEDRSALLSRRARRCAEHHLDLGRPAAQVAAALGLGSQDPGGAGRLLDRLDELGTPTDSVQRLRVADALAGIVSDGGGSQS